MKTSNRVQTNRATKKSNSQAPVLSAPSEQANIPIQLGFKPDGFWKKCDSLSAEELQEVASKLDRMSIYIRNHLRKCYSPDAVGNMN